MWRTPMITQSVGVPLTAKRRSPISRSRNGSLSESECETPDWSYSGATTHTSSDSARAISRHASSPAAWMPSSLVMRMRMAFRQSAHLGVVPAKAGTHNHRPSKIFSDGGYGSPPSRGRQEGRGYQAQFDSLDHLHPTHVGREHVGHGNRAVLLLVGLHHGDQRAADRDARSIKRVDVADPFLGAVARVHAARLERAAIRAR